MTDRAIPVARVSLMLTYAGDSLVKFHLNYASRETAKQVFENIRQMWKDHSFADLDDILLEDDFGATVTFRLTNVYAFSVDVIEEMAWADGAWSAQGDNSSEAAQQAVGRNVGVGFRST